MTIVFMFLWENIYYFFILLFLTTLNTCTVIMIVFDSLEVIWYLLNNLLTLSEIGLFIVFANVCRIEKLGRC